MSEPRTKMGKALLDGPHIVEFSATGYGLQHPVRCRPDLMGCPHYRWLAGQDEPARLPGRYVMAFWPPRRTPTFTLTEEPDQVTPDAILAIEAEAAAAERQRLRELPIDDCHPCPDCTAPLDGEERCVDRAVLLAEPERQP